MPSRWEITLPGLDPAAVRLEHLHAMVSGWFDRSDAEHRATAKPYTLCPPRAIHRGTVIEIALLYDELADRLHTATTPGTRLRLGATWCLLRQPARPITTVDWHDFDQQQAAQAWCLRFVTPTTFRRGNAFTPNPSLRAILGSLRASWRKFAPATLPSPQLPLTPEPVWLTDIDVASHVVTISDRTVSGFTGRIRFVCDTGAPVATAVNQLIHLAPYAGVGAYTTRGFGMTRPESTWQPNPAAPHTAPQPAVP